MEDTSSLLNFLHSLVRYLVLISVAVAAFIAWRGLLLKLPILVWERMITIFAMIICHVQLVIGLILYMVRYEYIDEVMTGTYQRYWKYEHLTTMVLAITLVTLGRMLSKRAKLEGSKQMLIAVFFTAGLLLMLWAIPWPFTAMGEGREWL
jgi:hypothetical protein